jgi:hypothetical protein
MGDIAISCEKNYFPTNMIEKEISDDWCGGI